MHWHSLWRGFQSVLYYYLSCSPWYELQDARAQKKQGKKEKKEKDGRNLGSKDTYKQPSPYDTNPFWAEEIQLGPGPPRRKATKKQLRDIHRLRVLRSTPDSQGSDTILSSDERVQESKLERARSVEVLVPSSEKWKLHQRRDEPLWGSEEHIAASLDSASSRGARFSPNRYPIFRGGSMSSSSRLIARNPPVNDLSPPAVSNPAQGEKSNMWMLQPPPPAAVMSGYREAGCAPSTTTSSLSSRRTDHTSVSRKLSQRMIQEHANRSDMLYPPARLVPPTSLDLYTQEGDDARDDVEAGTIPVFVRRRQDTTAFMYHATNSSLAMEDSQDLRKLRTYGPESTNGETWRGPDAATSRNDFAFSRTEHSMITGVSQLSVPSRPTASRLVERPRTAPKPILPAATPIERSGDLEDDQVVAIGSLQAPQIQELTNESAADERPKHQSENKPNKKSLLANTLASTDESGLKTKRVRRWSMDY